MSFCLRSHKSVSLGIPALLVLCGAPAFAATLTVSNTNDSGDGSLRAAIAAASSGDIIDATGATGVIALQSPLTIVSNVTINGPGAASLAVNGSNTVACFSITVNASISGLTVENCAGVEGAAIYNSLATVSLTNMYILVNSASSGGGAISNAGGMMTLTGVTLSGNITQGVGGAIKNTGSLTVTNSTLANNSAQVNGGGIYSSGPVTVVSSTFSANSSNLGGAVYNNASTLSLQNTLLAGSEGGNCAGSMTSAGYNLSDDSTCALAGTGDLNNQAAGLDPNGLQNNSGPTPTIALLSTSAAVNRIPPANCAVAVDQRGVARPQGGNCDTGAYEYPGFTTFTCQLTPAIGPGAPGRGMGPISFGAQYEMSATFTVGSPLDVVNPVTQQVNVQLGSYLLNLAPGAFSQVGPGIWTSMGFVNNAFVQAEIQSLGNSQYELFVNPISIPFGAPSPMAVSVAVGLYSGTTSAAY